MSGSKGTAKAVPTPPTIDDLAKTLMEKGEIEIASPDGEYNYWVISEIGDINVYVYWWPKGESNEKMRMVELRPYYNGNFTSQEGWPHTKEANFYSILNAILCGLPVHRMRCDRYLTTSQTLRPYLP